MTPPEFEVVPHADTPPPRVKLVLEGAPDDIVAMMLVLLRPPGKKRPRVSLTADQVRDVRQRAANGEPKAARFLFCSRWVTSPGRKTC